MKPDSEKIVYDYKVRQWNSLEELEGLLNEMTNQGWRVENHHLASEASNRNYGWTIFVKATFINPPLLQRKIGVNEVYSILNRVLTAGSDPARRFDEGIKDAVRVEGDTF